MSEKRFSIKEGSSIPVFSIYTEDGKELSSLQLLEILNEQQATINLLLEELINAQQQGYVVDFLHKNERCNLTPKELEDE